MNADGRLVKHARCYWPMLAKGHLTRTRFAAMLRNAALLLAPANRSAGGAEQNLNGRNREEG